MAFTARVGATPLAAPVDLRGVRNATDSDLVAVLHPDYAGAVRRSPRGRTVIRGLPFDFGGYRSPARWLLVDTPVEINLAAHAPGSHVIVAHFCDAWREADGHRPPDLPVGWVTPAGQPLARYVLETRAGGLVEVPVRRRFEVNEGLVGWGQSAFAARPHQLDAPLDWRGPHPRLVPVARAPVGQAGLLAVLPGSWGPDQTGVADSVPSPTNDLMLWLLELAVPGGPTGLARLRLEPSGDVAAGTAVVVAGVTVFAGTASPLAIGPRRTIRISRARPGRRVRRAFTPSVGVDLGQIIGPRPAPPASPTGTADIVGWGSEADDHEPTAILVDLVTAPDASVTIDASRVPAAALVEGRGALRRRSLEVEALPSPDRRITVDVVDAVSNETLPARVSFRAADGRYIPPLGHRDEVNPGLNEDGGADVVLGATTYAYVPGRFPIAVPAGRVVIEAVHGFSHRPRRTELDVTATTTHVKLALEPISTPLPASEGWVAADCHVHFISPTSALLQARAEGVAVVNLLATQWGDHHTSIADLPSVAVADPAGRHIVVMGSENRQNMLGHIGLLGAPDAILPMASAGGPEGRLGDPLDRLMADWSDAARAQGGLAIAVHFPLPYAEVAADIVAGAVEAVEFQALTPDIDGPSVREWYRYLNCGFRLPVVGGTDKMTAEIPLGAIRTYARLDPAEELTFTAWARAVRAGRTSVSSGALIRLDVDGHEPGDVIRLPSGGGSVEVRATAVAAQPVLGRLELVHDGRVVASTGGPATAERLTLHEQVEVRRGGWLAARATSPMHIVSAFATAMGGHTSPVYLEVQGRPAFDADAMAGIATIIDGTRAWIETIAAVRADDERRRLASYLAAARQRLDELAIERSRVD